MDFGGKKGKGIIAKVTDDQRFESNYFGASIHFKSQGMNIGF